MARLRAVVVIHPPGFGGTPRSGHCSAAIANASATASSARSTSPRTRIKVAVQRPASRRKTSSRAGIRGADLDRPLAGGGALAGPLEGGVEVGRFDDPEAAHLLLGLGVGTVGHRHLAAVGADDRCRRRRTEPGSEHPGANSLHLVV